MHGMWMVNVFHDAAAYRCILRSSRKNWEELHEEKRLSEKSELSLMQLISG